MNDNETLHNDGDDKDACMRKVKPCILMEMIDEWITNTSENLNR